MKSPAPRYRWLKWSSWIGMAVALVAWDLSTRYWIATELCGIRFQFSSGIFSIGWWFDGTLGSWIKPSDHPDRSPAEALGLMLPGPSTSPLGYRFITLPMWILVALAAASAWIVTRLNKPLGDRTPWRWARTWRQRLAWLILIATIAAWWIAGRSRFLFITPPIATHSFAAEIGDGVIRIDEIRNANRMSPLQFRRMFLHIAARWYVIPVWLIAALVTVSAGFVLWRDRRDGLRDQCERCPNCNYNLTANESGTCPECGTPTTKSEPAMQEPAQIIRTRSASAGQDRVSLRDNSAKSSDDFR